MNRDVHHLHHVGHIVADLPAALEVYRRLGFTLAPPAYPAMSPAPGAPAVPFGPANTHADFERGFIELVTNAGRDAPLPDGATVVPLDVPDAQRPAVMAAIERTSAQIAASLDRFEGLHILMFHTPGADSAAARLTAANVPHGGVRAVRRPVETPDGTVEYPVRYLELDGAEPGRLPEGRVGLAEEPPPGGSTEHPNGATALTGCVLCVADDELDEVGERYESYLDRPARVEGRTRVFDLDGASLTLVARSDVDALLPGERPPATPAFIACEVAVRDLTRTLDLVRGNGLPVRTASGGGAFVPASAVLGAAVVFREA